MDGHCFILGGNVPAFLEKLLKKSAAKKGFSGKRANKYVFGAMNNLGAVRGNKITPKGARMQKQHMMKISSLGRAH